MNVSGKIFPMIESSQAKVTSAISLGLMHGQITNRIGKIVTLQDGSEVTEFANCSYLGLDQDERLLRAAKSMIDQYGIHICVARSRLTPEPHFRLESNLSKIFKSSAITFPSVSVTHLAVLPLLSEFLGSGKNLQFVFDRFAHASMQALIPLLKGQGMHVHRIDHNSLEQLEDLLRKSPESPLIYLCDGFYSMGGQAPLAELKSLQEKYPHLFLYIDDAHGTSIIGENGSGYAIDIFGELNERTLVCFSLAKGFGCNGGGIVLNNPNLENLIRQYSSPYAFSGPLEYAGTGAALASSEIHLTSEIRTLQSELVSRVHYFDELAGTKKNLPFNPIRAIPIGDAEVAIEAAKLLKEDGFFVPVVFYPVVSKDQALLRVVLSKAHTNEQIFRLIKSMKAILGSLDVEWTCSI